MQLKGADAAMTRTLSTDIHLAKIFKDNFIRELKALGYNPRIIEAIMTCPETKLSAITFTPHAVFPVNGGGGNRLPRPLSVPKTHYPRTFLVFILHPYH
jgi:hypothetical protein